MATTIPRPPLGHTSWLSAALTLIPEHTGFYKPGAMQAVYTGLAHDTALLSRGELITFVEAEQALDSNRQQALREVREWIRTHPVLLSHFLASHICTAFDQAFHVEP